MFREHRIGKGIAFIYVLNFSLNVNSVTRHIYQNMHEQIADLYK